MYIQCKNQKNKFQPIKDKTALSKEASLIIAKYEWLEIGHIRKGFVNFQAKSYEPDHKRLVFEEKNINVKEMEEALEAYPDFLSSLKIEKICLALSGFHIAKFLPMKYYRI
ncbi:hypothetical protein C1646_767444 [Rhizophagus diaphanus]|nr:hypothetical protein C1646_767444 [Rhizophagus diaphanus] [Rhizophagus sp. MUCL 43196]